MPGNFSPQGYVNLTIATRFPNNMFVFNNLRCFRKLTVDVCHDFFVALARIGWSLIHIVSAVYI